MNDLLDKIDEVDVRKALRTAAATAAIGTTAMLGGKMVNKTFPQSHVPSVVKTARATYNGPEVRGTTLNKGVSSKPLGTPKINIDSIISIESSNNPNTPDSPKGARGLMQIMRPTWEEITKKLGVDWPWEEANDSKKNRVVGEYYMNVEIPRLLKHYKIEDTLENRLAAYNWGVGNLRYNDWRDAPPETINYIKKYKAMNEDFEDIFVPKSKNEVLKIYKNRLEELGWESLFPAVVEFEKRGMSLTSGIEIYSNGLIFRLSSNNDKKLHYIKIILNKYGFTLGRNSTYNREHELYFLHIRKNKKIKEDKDFEDLFKPISDEETKERFPEVTVKLSSEHNNSIKHVKIKGVRDEGGTIKMEPAKVADALGITPYRVWFGKGVGGAYWTIRFRKLDYIVDDEDRPMIGTYRINMIGPKGEQFDEGCELKGSVNSRPSQVLIIVPDVKGQRNQMIKARKIREQRQSKHRRHRIHFSDV